MTVPYLERQLGSAEHVDHVERHHWIFLFSEMTWSILIAAGMLALILGLQGWWARGQGWTWYLYLFLLIPLARIAWGYLSWRMNVYVITNRRVVEVSGVINRTVSDSSLEKVNDVVLRQGIIGRLLGYGTIQVITASEAGINRLKQIRRPFEFKTAMFDAKERMEREFGASH